MVSTQNPGLLPGDQCSCSMGNADDVMSHDMMSSEASSLFAVISVIAVVHFVGDYFQGQIKPHLVL